MLDDVTRRTWVLRHLGRALVQLAPVVALCLVVAPVPFSFRLSAAVGGLLMGLLFSLAYMTETTEHRAVKAGYPPGTTARVRAERVEREQLERRARYRQGGSGSQALGAGNESELPEGLERSAYDPVSMLRDLAPGK